MTPAMVNKLPALRDIHLPPEPGFWPPAPGWWLTVLLLLLLSAWLTVRLRDLYHLKRQRRELTEAMDRLDRDCGKHEDALFAAGVSALLRRLALQRFPQDPVAPLNGQDWLAFLDRHGGQQKFQNGPGCVLAEAPYAPDQTFDRMALKTLATEWIRANTRSSHHRPRILK